MTNTDAAGGWNGGAGFDPIGDNTGQFMGRFDGLGHTITGLTINRPTTVDVGLFGFIGTGGEIRNLGLVGAIELAPRDGEADVANSLQMHLDAGMRVPPDRAVDDGPAGVGVILVFRTVCKPNPEADLVRLGMPGRGLRFRTVFRGLRAHPITAVIGVQLVKGAGCSD